MKINFNTVLIGKSVILVPYRKEHVEQYHKWMQSPELLAATASEPLTLAEEFENQISWHRDEHKCTFILLDPAVPDTPTTGNHGGGMIGDVNLFFNDDDDPNSAEVEIMIAEPKARGKGIGKEAVLLMMRYGLEALKVQRFTAKIGDQNTASIEMFKKLGFSILSHSSVFSETTLELLITPWTRDRIMNHTNHMKQGTYDPET